MQKPDLALIGRARAGKDSVADYLVREHGYVRVAFADALKEMALAADPILGENCECIGAEDDARYVRLSDYVTEYGYERAKDMEPEVRRFLQDLGVAVRSHQPSFWLDQGLTKAGEAMADGRPVVFTDVRFLNEVRALEMNEYLTVSITRPCRITEGLDATGTHVSETELANYPTDRNLCNAGSIADLEADVRKYLLGM